MTRAKLTQVPLLGNLAVSVNETDVTIDGATIEGGEVEVISTADSQHFLTASDVGGGSSSAAGSSLIDTLIHSILGVSFFAGLAVSKSTATIKIGSTTATPTIISADDFTAISTANVAPYAAPIGIKGASTAVGVAITDAETTIGAATITTTGDTTIRASMNAATNVVADVTAPRSFALAVTVGNYTTTADVMPEATLNVGGDLFVQADTTMARRNLARTVSGGDGQVGVAVAVDVIHSDANAYLDGTATVQGAVNVTAKETTNTETGFKDVLIPALLVGVNANAGVGSNSTGEVLDDLQNKGLEKIGTHFLPSLTSWVKQTNNANNKNCANSPHVAVRRRVRGRCGHDQHHRAHRRRSDAQSQGHRQGDRRRQRHVNDQFATQHRRRRLG